MNGSQFVFLTVSSAQPFLRLINLDVLFIAWIIVTNVINSFMEEGLFRGLMMRQFMTSLSFFKANLMQSILFGVWHIIWPLKALYTGEIGIIGTVLYSVQYVISTFIMAYVMGYLFFKTGSLWSTITWHTVWNSWASAITLETLATIGSDVMVTYLFLTLSVGVGVLFLSLLLIKSITSWKPMPAVSPWGSVFSKGG